VTSNAARAVVSEVQHATRKIETSVPPKVVEEMERHASGASQSGQNLAVVKPDPPRGSN
jgi:hypothetical protein